MVDIEPYSSTELSFPINSDADITSTQVMLAIWPVNHEYALKELMFPIILSSSLIGDINSDGVVNILDVVVLINIILGAEDENVACDLNGDNIVNILDVVLLVNFILGPE